MNALVTQGQPGRLLEETLAHPVVPSLAALGSFYHVLPDSALVVELEYEQPAELLVVPLLVPAQPEGDFVDGLFGAYTSEVGARPEALGLAACPPAHNQFLRSARLVGVFLSEGGKGWRPVLDHALALDLEVDVSHQGDSPPRYW